MKNRFDPAIPNAKGADEHSSKKSDEVVIEVAPVELDEAAQIEARRKRREELKAKLTSQPTPLLVQALHISDSGPATPQTNTPRESRSGKLPSKCQLAMNLTILASPAVDSPRSQNAADSPSAFRFDDDQELANQTKSSGPSDDADGPSAADYDPTIDMEEDRTREDQRTHTDISASGYDENADEQHDILMPDSKPQMLEEPAQPKKNEFDMFADDDDDDMFALDLVSKPTASTTSKPKTLDANLLDNWDDPDGYYRVILGELLDGRYHVQAHLGKGMFAAVVRAEDSKTGSPVAIKIVRNNETMKKAGLKEIDILQKLSIADPEGKKHVIRLERHFEHKGHLCMVFENMR
jgi:serine/threonine-protein kinase PRP4